MRATFPAGIVSGAPKIRAMQIIAELEDIPYPYAGCVGYYSFAMPSRWRRRLQKN